jgi:hypothetical protein
MKSQLRGRRFQDIPQNQEQLQTDLHAIKKIHMEQQQNRWTGCINSKRAHFEVDDIQQR